MGEIALSEQNKQVALNFIKSMSEGDPELGDACLGPDAFAVSKGFGKFSGIRRRETMVGTIAAFNQLLPTGLCLAVKSVTAEGDKVVVECEGNAMTRDGKPYCNQYCFIFTFNGGKISRLDEYFCNRLADDVLWPLVSAMGQALAAD
jgi:ketosteroid isomerase-like protein